MRHGVKGKRLSRDTDHRKMLRRTLMTQFFRHEKIKTTPAKVQAIRSESEKLITLARNRGDAERLAELAAAGDEEMLKTLLTDAQVRRLLEVADDSDTLGRETRAIVAHAQRLVARKITDREILHKLFHDIAPRYVGRNGGYTRVFKLGLPRKGDRAEMVVMELVEES